MILCRPRSPQVNLPQPFGIPVVYPCDGKYRGCVSRLHQFVARASFTSACHEQGFWHHVNPPLRKVYRKYYFIQGVKSCTFHRDSSCQTWNPCCQLISQCSTPSNTPFQNQWTHSVVSLRGARGHYVSGKRCRANV